MVPASPSATASAPLTPGAQIQTVNTPNRLRNDPISPLDANNVFSDVSVRPSTVPAPQNPCETQITNNAESSITDRSRNSTATGSIHLSRAPSLSKTSQQQTVTDKSCAEGQDFPQSTFPQTPLASHANAVSASNDTNSADSEAPFDCPSATVVSSDTHDRPSLIKRVSTYTRQHTSPSKPLDRIQLKRSCSYTHVQKASLEFPKSADSSCPPTTRATTQDKKPPVISNLDGSLASGPLGSVVPKTGDRSTEITHSLSSTWDSPKHHKLVPSSAEASTSGSSRPLNHPVKPTTVSQQPSPPRQSSPSTVTEARRFQGENGQETAEKCTTPHKKVAPVAKPPTGTAPAREFWDGPRLNVKDRVADPFITVKVLPRAPTPTWQKNPTAAMIAPFPYTRHFCSCVNRRRQVVNKAPQLSFTPPANTDVNSVGDFQRMYERVRSASSATDANTSPSSVLANLGLSCSTLSRIRNPHSPHETLLQFALTRNHLNTFLLLLNECPSLLYETDCELKSVAHSAVNQNNSVALKRIYEKDIGIFNHVSSQGLTPFSCAVKMGKLEAVRFLASQPGIVWNSCETPGLSVICESLTVCCAATAGFVSPLASKSDRKLQCSVLSFKDKPSSPRSSPPSQRLRAKSPPKNQTKSDLIIVILDTLLQSAVANGINLNALADNGSGTLLHHAVSQLSQSQPPFAERHAAPVSTPGIRALELLLSTKTVNLHQRDAQGRTALDLAVQNNTQPAIRLLTESVASAKQQRGKTVKP